jgi:predicted TIM-barrel fold metal-dependent hydrolase
MKNRREFLTGAAALGAGLLVSQSNSAGQSNGAVPARIDVHSHFAPPAYISEIKPKGVANPQMFDWTPARHIEEMDRAGVATSVISISPPGVWFDNNPTGDRISRTCNDYAARFASDNKGRIGLFAALPVPDLDGSLKEVAYALDSLKADGISMYTNYGDKWLGDPFFAPLFEELNRRKAVVYTHPISANCCRNLLMPDVADSAIEWGTDTTRAITRLIFSGSAAKYPDIRFIFSHAGGTMPYLVERFDLMAKTTKFAPQFPQGFVAAANKLYYDTAQTANPAAMSALRKVVNLSQIVFGTDYPYRTCTEHVKGLKECGQFTAKELLAVDRTNALALLPRYKAS